MTSRTRSVAKGAAIVPDGSTDTTRTQGGISRATVEEVLKVEPGLTVAKLCARTCFYAENWLGFTDGLRLAGLPE
jgi:hypothetical protein